MNGVMWYILLKKQRQDLSEFFFLHIHTDEWWNWVSFIIIFWHCVLSLSLGVFVDSETDQNSWKVSPSLPILKKKTYSLIMKMWLNFYTYIHSWQSCFKPHESKAVCKPRFVGKTSKPVEQSSLANKFSVRYDIGTAGL